MCLFLVRHHPGPHRCARLRFCGARGLKRRRRKSLHCALVAASDHTVHISPVHISQPTRHHFISQALETAPQVAAVRPFASPGPSSPAPPSRHLGACSVSPRHLAAAMQVCSGQRALRGSVSATTSAPWRLVGPTSRGPCQQLRRRPPHVTAAAAAEELAPQAAAPPSPAAVHRLNMRLNNDARREQQRVAAGPGDSSATLRKGTLFGALSLIVGNTVGAGM